MTNANPTGASPIADLTYRPYDGPLYTRAARWWIIAVARLRYLRTRWWFWLLIVLSLMPYIIVSIFLYVQSLAPKGADRDFQLFFDNTPGQKFAVMFFRGLTMQGFWLFLIAMAAGAGSIAMDNRTNALQVYLSKPLTKRDYLFGKWMGIFMTIYGAAVMPAIIFFLYCLLTYSSEGFLSSEPWLIGRVLAACAIPAAIHASLLVGFSAWSKTPLLAGVVHAGFYFATQILAAMIWGITTHGQPDKGLVAQHSSVEGVISGLEQWVFGITFNVTHLHRRFGIKNYTLPPPDAMVMIGLAAVLIIAGVVAARIRIRAVEVVRG